MPAIKRPTLADKLGAWQMAYDAIRDHVFISYGFKSRPPDEQTADAIEAAIIAAAASLVGGIQW